MLSREEEVTECIKDVKSGKGGVMTHNGEPYILKVCELADEQYAQYQVRR